MWSGDNDAVRFSLIKGSAKGDGKALMYIHLKHESLERSQAWLPRVPTKPNISNFPSGGASRLLLEETFSESEAAFEMFVHEAQSVLSELKRVTKGERPHSRPHALKRG